MTGPQGMGTLGGHLNLPVEFAGVGTFATGNLSPLNPGLPPGAVPGDLLVLHVATGEAGAVGLSLPWMNFTHRANSAFSVKYMVEGEIAPTVTRTGSGMIWSAYITAWRAVRTIEYPKTGAASSIDPVTAPNYIVDLDTTHVLNLMNWGIHGNVSGPNQSTPGWLTALVSNHGTPGNNDGGVGTASKESLIDSLVMPTWSPGADTSRTYEWFSLGLQPDVGAIPEIAQTVTATGANMGTTPIAMPTFIATPPVGSLAIYILARNQTSAGVFSVSAGWTLIGPSTSLNTTANAVAARILNGGASDTLSVSCTGSGAYTARGLLIENHSASVVTDVKTAISQVNTQYNSPPIDMGSTQRTLLMSAYAARTNTIGQAYAIPPFFTRYATVIDYLGGGVWPALSLNTREVVGRGFDPDTVADAASGCAWTIGVPGGTPAPAVPMLASVVGIGTPVWALNGSPTVVTIPSSSVGDTLFLHLTAQGTATFSGMTGWTLVKRSVSGAFVSEIWKRVKESGDTTVTYTPSVSTFHGAYIIACANINVVSEVQETIGANSTTPQACPGFIAPSGSLVLNFIGWRYGRTPTTQALAASASGYWTQLVSTIYPGPNAHSMGCAWARGQGSSAITPVAAWSYGGTVDSRVHMFHQLYLM